MAMFKHFIQEGVIRSELESFLRSELNKAGYSRIDIQKTPLATRIILYVEKPPIVIGKKGKRINKLTKILKEKYGLDTPTIDVQKVERPILDSNIVARRIATALERGMNRRRVAYKALRAVLGAGARGIEIVLAGKIVGKGGRSRTEKYSQGYMKKAGDSFRLVNVGSTQAYLKAGVIGITVKIVPPDTRFPDQLEVLPPKIEEESVKTETKVTEEKESVEPEKRSRKRKTRSKAKAEEKTAESPAESALDSGSGANAVSETVLPEQGNTP